MKVLLLSYLFNPSAGTELGIVRKWANAYSSLGHNVTVWTSKSQEKYFIDVDFSEFNFKIDFIGSKSLPTVESPQSVMQLFDMRRNIKTWYKHLRSDDMQDFDLIHHVTLSTIRIKSPVLQGDLKPLRVWGPLGGGQVSNLRHVPKKEIFLEFSRNLSVKVLPKISRYDEVGSNSCHVMVTNADTKIFAESVGLKNVSFELSDGIESETILRSFRKLAKGSSQEYEFLWAGRLVRSKRPDVAIRMIKALSKMDLDVKLHIAGDGPARLELENLTQQLELENKVIFHGKIPWADMNKLIDRVNFTVFSSVRDNSAPIILESAARGVPSLALRIHGVSTMYPDNVAIGPTHLSKSISLDESLAFLRKDLSIIQNFMNILPILPLTLPKPKHGNRKSLE